MKLFAELVDRLAHAPSADIKRAWLVDYLRRAPDPDRGIALSLLVGDQDFTRLSPAMVRQLGASRIDSVLFTMSHDFVGDLAETKALTWPERASNHDVPRLHEVVGDLATLKRAEVVEQIETWLDTLDATERWALLKLVTGRLAVGVSSRLVRLSLADFGGAEIGEIEEVWHGLERPYTALFDWLEGRGERPFTRDKPTFRPLMRAQPVDADAVRGLDLAAYAAEWKCDGLAVQLSGRGGESRLYSSDGDDISGAFPEIIEAMRFEAVLDGVLLVARDGKIGSFDDLGIRLGRKAVSTSVRDTHPAHVRVHDMVFDGAEDLRGLPFDARRRRLAARVGSTDARYLSLSEPVLVRDHEDLAGLHAACRERECAGLMLKRRDSVYTGGEPTADWVEWIRDPLIVDTVLMYIQGGVARRSLVVSEITLGAWREAGTGLELVPVGKTMFDRRGQEDDRFEQWVREHTVKRYGPVSEVEPILVVELACDGARRSTRHKAGLVLREPKARGIRWDKPAAGAGRLETLRRWCL